MLSSGAKIDSHLARKSALRIVASIELCKGILVLLMGLSALLLVRQDVWVIAESVLAVLHINTDRRYAQMFLDFADNITNARLWAAAQLAFTYSLLRFVEGYGLWRERTWAEWFAVISGTLLLPLEIRELFRGITLVRSLVFGGNLVIVLYMLHVLREGRRLRAAEISSQARSRAGSAN
jgi:uncharacterized membrane protein (DUF2068 family)